MTLRRTNNGLMHVLDAVMVPLEQMNATASRTPTGTPSATASPTSESANPASSTGVASTIAIGKDGWNWTLVVMFGVAVIFAEGLGGRYLLIR